MPAGSVGVVVAHDDRHVIEQVAEALDAAADLVVSSTSLGAAGAGQVVVAGGAVLLGLGRVAAPLVALAEADPIRAARAALAAGAADIVRWPEEADRLPGAIRRAAGARERTALSGRAVAVLGARGGVGTSTVAAALAAALGDALVLDFDGGQRAFAAGEPPPPPGADVSPEALAAALLPHPGGARCLHAGGREPSAEDAHALLRAARELSPAVVVDCGRGAGLAARAVAATAEARVLVAADDVASVRGGRALLDRPALLAVRRARRGGVALRDLAAALGCEPAAVIREDRALARAVDLGRLPARPTRAMRAIARLARAVRAALESRP